MAERLRVNENIKAPKVRLIDQDNKQVGIVSREEALFAAKNVGLDLVEVSSSGDTPVCKILDYGKYKYQQEKKLQKSKKLQKNQEIKIIRLSMKIGKHDLETKIKKAQKFLEKGHTVHIEIMFRGREMVHKDLGEKLLNDFISSLGKVQIIQDKKMASNRMSIRVSRDRKEGNG